MENHNKKDVTEIYFRTSKKEFKIKTFDMTREDAIRAYEEIAKNKDVTFACAFVVGGSRI